MASLHRHSFSRRRSIVLAIVAVLALAAAAATTHVWTRLRVIELGYQISKAGRAHTELLQANQRLRIEVALLKSPARITQIAVKELGLQQPRPEQIRRLRVTRAEPSPPLAKAER